MIENNTRVKQGRVTSNIIKLVKLVCVLVSLSRNNVLTNLDQICQAINNNKNNSQYTNSLSVNYKNKEYINTLSVKGT